MADATALAASAIFDTQDFYLEVERQLEDLYNFIHETHVKQPTTGGLATRLKQHLMQDIRYVKALTGNVTNITNTASGIAGSMTNPLVHSEPASKNIMGIDLTGRGVHPVTKKDLTPKKDEAAKFKSDVKDLYAGFLGMKDKDLLNIVSKPGGETLIRGVAKTAGVLDYASRDSSEIDFAFFADIRAAITNKAKGDALNAALDTETETEAEPNLLDVVDEAPETEVEPAPTPKKKAAGKKNLLADDDDDDV
jgi:hypothetical protein